MENKTFTLPANLCINIYNYLEKNLNTDNAEAFVVLKQEMTRQDKEAQKQEAMEKLRSEVKVEFSDKEKAYQKFEGIDLSNE